MRGPWTPPTSSPAPPDRHDQPRWRTRGHRQALALHAPVTRGDQWAPSGVRIAWYCWGCTGADVTSANPRPGPNPPPGDRLDPKALRRDR